MLNFLREIKHHVAQFDLYVIAFKRYLQVKRFDAFEHVKANIAEFNIFTATEHEPMVKV